MEFVYILKCRDDSLYTGWTNDIEKRLRAHNSGKGAKYTRNRSPVELVHLEIFEDRLEALRRERAIKRMTRIGKLEMIRDRRKDTQALIKEKGIGIELVRI